MKKLILIFVMMIPLAGFSQWTQEQQDQYRKQMDEFRKQMDEQMATVRDSLQQLQKEMHDIDWSAFDTMRLEMPEMPEMPEAPEAPGTYSRSGETETFPGG